MKEWSCEMDGKGEIERRGEKKEWEENGVFSYAGRLRGLRGKIMFFFVCGPVKNLCMGDQFFRRNQL